MKNGNPDGLEIMCKCADGIDRDGDRDLADGELDGYRDKKSAKEFNNQLEVAIGDGMEFTIHGNHRNNFLGFFIFNDNAFISCFRFQEI